MKKIFLYTAILVSSLFFITSCAKTPIGNTATEKMAGAWYVKVYAVDISGNVVYDDPYGLGMFHLDTYNTSNNSTDKMWINDNANFWDFQVKMNVNMTSMSFAVDTAQNVSYDSKVTIFDGKILPGAATTPSGVAADSIVFNVTFNDDTNPANYGFDHYRVSGFRYTGFTKDN